MIAHYAGPDLAGLALLVAEGDVGGGGPGQGIEHGMSFRQVAAASRLREINSSSHLGQKACSPCR